MVGRDCIGAPKPKKMLCFQPSEAISINHFGKIGGGATPMYEIFWKISSTQPPGTVYFGKFLFPSQSIKFNGWTTLLIRVARGWSGNKIPGTKYHPLLFRRVVPLSDARRQRAAAVEFGVIWKRKRVLVHARTPLYTAQVRERLFRCLSRPSRKKAARRPRARPRSRGYARES